MWLRCVQRMLRGAADKGLGENLERCWNYNASCCRDGVGQDGPAGRLPGRSSSERAVQAHPDCVSCNRTTAVAARAALVVSSVPCCHSARQLQEQQQDSAEPQVGSTSHKTAASASIFCLRHPHCPVAHDLSEVCSASINTQIRRTTATFEVPQSGLVLPQAAATCSAAVGTSQLRESSCFCALQCHARQRSLGVFTHMQCALCWPRSHRPSDPLQGAIQALCRLGSACQRYSVPHTSAEPHNYPDWNEWS